MIRNPLIIKRRRPYSFLRHARHGGPARFFSFKAPFSMANRKKLASWLLEGVAFVVVDRPVGHGKNKAGFPRFYLRMCPAGECSL